MEINDDDMPELIAGEYDDDNIKQYFPDVKLENPILYDPEMVVPNPPDGYEGYYTDANRQSMVVREIETGFTLWFGEGFGGKSKYRELCEVMSYFNRNLGEIS